MNELARIFKYENQQIRTLEKDGKPWFVAKDICAVLGLKKVSQVVNGHPDKNDRLDDDEKGVSNVDTLGGNQQLLIVSESGLYSLIFKSRKKEARAFQKWVTKEVLPSIRKTGKYSANGEHEYKTNDGALHGMMVFARQKGLEETACAYKAKIFSSTPSKKGEIMKSEKLQAILCTVQSRVENARQRVLDVKATFDSSEEKRVELHIAYQELDEAEEALRFAEGNLYRDRRET